MPRAPRCIESSSTDPYTNLAIEAFRKVDFVLTEALAFTPTAQYSDIVLPVATSWESEEGLDYHLGQQNRETLMWQQLDRKSTV